MYSSNNPNDHHKYSASPPLSAPSFSQPLTTGIPESLSGQFYPENSTPPPPPPPPLQIKSKTQVPWTTGLCDCGADVRNCCITCWCPCITFGKIAEIIDKGSSSCGANGALYTLIFCMTGCPCFYSCFYRSKLRQQYSLKKSPCGDCLVHCCCGFCALCQEYRELKNHGYDLSIGWHGNVESQTRGVMMAPIIEECMSR